ncbi:diacylglycerol O-acyltransferase 1-like isoform X1 [Dermacentor silvarum]|uniref:diacylglycerol O-acyltransferase 1-like isoform X1 n=1 Tax=Dermacentor silvarum TaxID=543639 RepID=UPI00189968CE|nr:diacylglycerol O-acyltransferase 1-like isoform X1 [Dermacentor silvarum]
MATIRNRGTVQKTVSTEEVTACFPKATITRSLSKSASPFQFLCRQFHKPRESLLSQPGAFIRLKGFTNFTVVLLILFNLKLAVYNLSRTFSYCELTKWLLYVLADTGSIPPLLAAICFPVAVCVSLQAEKLLATKKVGTKTFAALIAVNLAVLLAAPPLFLLQVPTNLVASIACIWLTVIVWLKLVSYHMVNYSFRWEDPSEPKTGNGNVSLVEKDAGAVCQNVNGAATNGHIAKLVVYPDNLYAADIWYFMFAPTLCYEINFPQRPKIRKLFLLRTTFEVILIPVLSVTLLNQWALPVLAMAAKAFEEMDAWELFKAYIDLMVWNTIFWLMMSFWLFHSALNWIGEVLGFADRDFYRDWWNADSVRAFWNRWNLPVHRWCWRHIYSPLVSAGFTKNQAQMAVFVVSAVFHEYISSLPLKTIYGVAFAGMAIQLPLFYLYDNVILERFPKFGNAIVMLLFIFLMPAVVTLYYCKCFTLIMGEQ